MRRYIVKKSVVPIPPASGSVSDTLNVTDKTTNAPSVRLVEELIGTATGSTPVEVPTKTSQLENDSGFITSDAIPASSEVLWTNSSPSNSFGSQTITLKTNTYKYFRIFYRMYNSSNRVFTMEIRPGDGFDANFIGWYTPSGVGYLAYYYRSYCSSSQNKITFSDCLNIKSNSTTINTDNTSCIPVQVVGFN